MYKRQILSKAALTEWNRFDPAGYRAYAHFKNGVKLDEELMTSYCREITEEYQLPMPKMNSKYFAYVSKSFDLALMAGVIAIVLIGGYIVIQSIFRISINDKIQSYLLDDDKIQHLCHRQRFAGIAVLRSAGGVHLSLIHI